MLALNHLNDPQNVNTLIIMHKYLRNSASRFSLCSCSRQKVYKLSLRSRLLRILPCLLKHFPSSSVGLITRNLHFASRHDILSLVLSNESHHPCVSMAALSRHVGRNCIRPTPPACASYEQCSVFNATSVIFSIYLSDLLLVSSSDLGPP